MEEQQNPQGSTGLTPAGAANHAAAALEDRRRRVAMLFGGLLAGFGLSLTAAFVMHVVQEVSPNGYAFSITGNVVLELLIAGPIFGLGLAMALGALIPPASASSPGSEHSPSQGG